MNKNIVIVGDSFCANSSGWPQQLADKLELSLICHGIGGQSWWNAKNFIDSLRDDDLAQAEVLIFVHTNADRVPTQNIQIGIIDHNASPESELETAIHLYYKYIHEPSFLHWAQQQWFMEITRRWAHKKIVHLHSFPWTIPYSNLLTGINIQTNLCSISLNELGTTEFKLFNDKRLNHLNHHNNNQLAVELTSLIKNYQNQKINLGTDRFDLKTTHWFDWN